VCICCTRRFRYKEDYELFKLYVTLVTLILASVICFFVNYRFIHITYTYLLTCSEWLPKVTN